MLKKAFFKLQKIEIELILKYSNQTAVLKNHIHSYSTLQPLEERGSSLCTDSTRVRARVQAHTQRTTDAAQVQEVSLGKSVGMVLNGWVTFTLLLHTLLYSVICYIKNIILLYLRYCLKNTLNAKK